MKNNFRTLINAVLFKVSALFPKKEDVYTKEETYSKNEVDETVSEVNERLDAHGHSYTQFRSVKVELPFKNIDGSPIYADNKFVIMSTEDKVVYSHDGISWSETTLPRTYYTKNIVYGDNKFVIVPYSSSYAYYSNDGISWVETKLTAYNNWTNVVYANGRFVIVSNSSRVNYSEDGVTWSESSMPSGRWNHLYSLNGKFIATESTSSKLAYSNDGIEWFETTWPSFGAWNSIVYANDRFIAATPSGKTYSTNIKYDAKVAYSEDLTTWNEYSIPYSGNWAKVFYVNDTIILTDKDNGRIVYSYDGSVWHENIFSKSLTYEWISYASGKFIVHMRTKDLNSDPRYYYSYDLENWFEIKMPDYVDYTELVCNNDKILLVSKYDGYIVYSEDGVNWSDVYTEMRQDGDSVPVLFANDVNAGVYAESTSAMPYDNSSWLTAYGNGRYVALMYDSDKAVYSDDGINWHETPKNIPVSSGWRKVMYDNGLFIAAGHTYYTNTESGNTERSIQFVCSEDGVTWNTVSASIPTNCNYINDMICGNGKFILAADDYGCYYSEDGINWTQIDMGEYRWSTIAYGNGRYVVLTYNSDKAAYSDDGVTWIETTLPFSDFWWDIEYGDNKFVAITSDDKGAYSYDGINWTEMQFASYDDYCSIAYGFGKFVVVGSNIGKITYSYDGINWLEAETPHHTIYYNEVIFGDNKFVATSMSNKVAYSYDGITWYEAGNIQLFQDGIPITPKRLGLVTEEDIKAIVESGVNSSTSPAIIDVLSLPETDINGTAFYRLMTGSLVFSQTVNNAFTCHCVDGLPETGEPATNADQSAGNVYYNIQDGNAYGYVDDMLSMGLGVPVGWYDGATLMGALGYEYKGVITDIDDAPQEDSFRLLLTTDFYIYQDGWCKLPFAYEKQPEFDIQWDGVIGDRFVLDASAIGFENTQFVKVSDEILSAEQVVGHTVCRTDGYYTSDYIVDEYGIDNTSYPGAIDVNSYVVVVYSADDLNSALGLPSGYLTNGIYFVCADDGSNRIYTNRLVSPGKVTKIDNKYLDLAPVAFTGDYYTLYNRPSLAVVATSGSYNNLSNKPTIYSDVIRYNVTQSLNSSQQINARNNIGVYSKSEVDAKVAELISVDTSNIATKQWVETMIENTSAPNLSEYAKTADVEVMISNASASNLSEYAKTADVEAMISNAIVTAIGGSY